MRKTGIIVISVLIMGLLSGVRYKYAFADELTLKTLLPPRPWVYSTDAGHENDIYYKDGKVGIGTSTPGQRLSVCGTPDSSLGLGVPGTVNGQDASIWLITKDANLNGSMWAVPGDNQDKGWRIAAFGAADATYPNDLQIRRINRADSTYTCPLAIDFDTSNVGINKRNATAPLEVRGRTNDNTESALLATNFRGDELLRVKNNGSVGIGPAQFSGILNVATDTGTGQLVISDTRNIDYDKKHRMIRLYNGALTFQKLTESGVEEQFVIEENGTVGIGTASPVTTSSTKLHVSGGHILLDNDKQINSLDTDGTTIRTLLQLKAGQTEVNYKGAGSFAITRAGVEKVIVSNTGNVGIGRVPLARTLEVEGKASKTAAGEWLANSDMRIKTGIQDITGALDVINRLHPVKFRYKDEYRAKHPSLENRYYYNFIAQEFQKVFPDSVKDDGEGYLQLDIHNVKPYLVAAVQELNKESKDLKAQNKNLKAKNEELETRIKNLEAKVASR